MTLVFLLGLRSPQCVWLAWKKVRKGNIKIEETTQFGVPFVGGDGLLPGVSKPPWNSLLHQLQSQMPPKAMAKLREGLKSKDLKTAPRRSTLRARGLLGIPAN